MSRKILTTEYTEITEKEKDALLLGVLDGFLFGVANE